MAESESGGGNLLLSGYIKRAAAALQRCRKARTVTETPCMKHWHVLEWSDFVKGVAADGEAMRRHLADGLKFAFNFMPPPLI